MNEYEVFTEEITPCGGTKYARRNVIEVEADSPEAYVRENGRYPIIEITEQPNGDVKVITGDGNGYFINYVFSE